MKKLAMGKLSAILLGELLLFVMLLMLTGVNGYAWIGVVTLAVILVVTFYCFCCRLSDAFAAVSDKIIDAANKNNADMAKLCIENTEKLTSKLNAETEKLTSRLTESANDCVEKIGQSNAQALASIKENNAQHIAELDKKIAEIANQQQKFSENAMNVLTKIKENIEKQEENNADFKKDINELLEKLMSENSAETGKLVSELGGKMEKLVSELHTEMEAFKENIVKYSDSFINKLEGKLTESANGCVERLGQANEQALASIKENNAQHIAELNEKIAELTEQQQKFLKDAMNVLVMMEEDIEEQKENNDAFNDAFNKDICELFEGNLDECDRKLNRYNEMFAELSDKIQEVIEACRNNTEEYEKQLQLILGSQKNTEVLNSEDIELLKNFMSKI